MLRRGVRLALEACDDLQICCEAGTAAEALERTAADRPDVVLVDITLPDGDGLDLIRDLRIQYPDVRILVLTMHDEALYAERSLRAGAMGYVMKHEPPDRLVAGVRAVLNGELFISERLKKNLISVFLAPAARSPARTGIADLSNRELQVFEAIGRGLTTQQIAAQYCLSPKTIETYRANIRHKLGLENGNRLIHAAVRWAEAEAAGPNPDNASILDGLRGRVEGGQDHKETTSTAPRTSR